MTTFDGEISPEQAVDAGSPGGWSRRHHRVGHHEHPEGSGVEFTDFDQAENSLIGSAIDKPHSTDSNPSMSIRLS